MNKGSYRASSTERQKKDHYPTYFSITNQLLEVEDFPDRILEPCCGEHDAIGKVLRDNGKTVISSDLWYGPTESRADFLCRTEKVDCIITNPPFKLADEFLETALKVVTGKFAFMMPLDYIHGQSRYRKFFREGICLKTVYTLTRRPLFGKELRADGKYPTGATTFAWFVFDAGYTGLPTISWIDNNRYILRKGE